MSFRLATMLAFALCGCNLIPGLQAHDEAEARRLLNPMLFDGPSARFEGVTRATATDAKGKSGEVICGRVNAKNQLGAYVGFRRFVAVPVEGFAAISPDADARSSIEDRSHQEAFDALWPTCRGGRQT